MCLLRICRRFRLGWAPLVAGVSVSLLFAGCSRGDVEHGGDGGDEAAAGSHEITGEVVKVDAERGTLLVAHDEIPGFMPAMTMEFQVAPIDLKAAKEGQRIRATMYQTPEGFRLEKVWPLDPVAEKVVNDAAEALHRDTLTRGKTAYRAIGENLPDFALYNQDGELVQPARFRGKQLLINFIYTRCPDPHMCPLATTKMIQVQEAAKEAGITDLELISITLDPEFDTPAVLHAYAEARGIDTSNFSFLTGPEQAIKDLMAQLGVLAFEDGPLIKHTIATVLTDRNGRIIHREDGTKWDPQVFIERMRRAESSG